MRSPIGNRPLISDCTPMDRSGEEIEEIEEELSRLRTENAGLRMRAEQAEACYASVSNSTIWRLSLPLRRQLDWEKSTARELRKRLEDKKERRDLQQRQHSTDEIAEKAGVKLSILVPLYNTDRRMLREMIRSVQNQTSSCWELCLADGSDAEHGYVGQYCEKIKERDPRIRYRKLRENKGISSNTNAALELAAGSYIALLDHDDLLHPEAVAEVVRQILSAGADMLYTDEGTFHRHPSDMFLPHYKPDYAPDTLRTNNYICHFLCFRRTLLEKAGGLFFDEYNGSQDYDLVLRLTEKAEKIVHIPRILYYWRAHAASTASSAAVKPYVTAAARRALEAHLDRVGLKGTVQNSRLPTMYRIRYELVSEPLISIIIPNKDEANTLRACITSILKKSTYSNYEILVVENNSTSSAIFDYYKELRSEPKVRVLTYKGKGSFNYSGINNFAVRHAKGEHLLLLNNDTRVISPDWLQEMLMFSQRRDVGAVGAMLYYPDDTVQHAGVILGIGGIANHAHVNHLRGGPGYMGRMAVVQNYSAVTGACMMLRRKIWDEMQGLDENFAVAFNDVDLCVRIRRAGYLIVWTPYAELYHYESKSRGSEDTPEKQARFRGEVERFQSLHGDILEQGDPYYNPAFDLSRPSFELGPL